MAWRAAKISEATWFRWKADDPNFESLVQFWKTAAERRVRAMAEQDDPFKVLRGIEPDWDPKTDKPENVNQVLVNVPAGPAAGNVLAEAEAITRTEIARLKAKQQAQGLTEADHRSLKTLTDSLMSLVASAREADRRENEAIAQMSNEELRRVLLQELEKDQRRLLPKGGNGSEPQDPAG